VPKETPQQRRLRLQKAAADYQKAIADVSVDPEPEKPAAKKPAKKKAAAKK